MVVAVGGVVGGPFWYGIGSIGRWEENIWVEMERFLEFSFFYFKDKEIKLCEIGEFD